VLFFSFDARISANYNLDRYMKSLLGRGKTEGQDALQRLDMLTREECGMVAARHLEVTHDVSLNVKTAAADTQDMYKLSTRSVKVVEQVTCGVRDDVKMRSKIFYLHAHVDCLLPATEVPFTSCLQHGCLQFSGKRDVNHMLLFLCKQAVAVQDV
jgi:hypothetical protein